jgi:hypothetical protein
MTLQIQLTSAAESELAALARMKGLPLTEYVQSLLESLVIANVPVYNEITPEEHADALQRWARTFPYKRQAALSDEAISRDSLYDRASNE